MSILKKIKADPNAFATAMSLRNWSLNDINTTMEKFGVIANERRETNREIENLSIAVKEIEAELMVAYREMTPTEVANSLRFRATQLRIEISEYQTALTALQVREEAICMSIPNFPAPDVPEGENDAANIVVSTPLAVTRPMMETMSDHVELGGILDMLPLSMAADMAGSRMPILTGDLARLERALGQFMLDQAGDSGYVEVSPPLMVNGDILRNTGQLPKFKDDLYQIPVTGRDPKYLIPTAEVPLTNMIMHAAAEPPRTYRWCALTPCFRLEAGSSGQDTRGIFRQHQFYKTELVVACPPEEADTEFERMVQHVSEKVMTALGLPHRIVSLCTGDLGFSARKTYDVEVWIPSQMRYREISSISDCGDFQTGRMENGGTFRRNGERRREHYHTLNGSGVAVGRALIAVMENYQRPDRGIDIPAVLQPYMRGQKEILPDSERRLTP